MTNLVNGTRSIRHFSPEVLVHVARWWNGGVRVLNCSPAKYRGYSSYSSRVVMGMIDNEGRNQPGSFFVRRGRELPTRRGILRKVHRYVSTVDLDRRSIIPGRFKDTRSFWKWRHFVFDLSQAAFWHLFHCRTWTRWARRINQDNFLSLRNLPNTRE